MLYEKLKEIYKGKEISYSKLLMTDEWNKRRLEVLRQENANCLRCERTGSYTDDDDRKFRWVKTVTEAEREAGVIGRFC